jgi:hypothetical protein
VLAGHRLVVGDDDVAWLEALGAACGSALETAGGATKLVTQIEGLVGAIAA